MSEKKKKSLFSKRVILIIVCVIFLVFAIVGSIYPIARADPGVCNPETKRYRITNGELLGLFIKAKQAEIKRDHLIRTTNISFGCSIGNRAELYTF